jgi:hypothetical protein
MAMWLMPVTLIMDGSVATIPERSRGDTRERVLVGFAESQGDMAGTERELPAIDLRGPIGPLIREISNPTLARRFLQAAERQKPTL